MSFVDPGGFSTPKKTASKKARDQQTRVATSNSFSNFPDNLDIPLHLFEELSEGVEPYSAPRPFIQEEPYPALKPVIQECIASSIEYQNQYKSTSTKTNINSFSVSSKR